MQQIAKDLGVSPATVRSWKLRYKWGEPPVPATPRPKGKRNAHPPTQRNARPVSSETAHKLAQAVAGCELTEKEKLFCLYYVTTFNAAQSYARAYDCAYSTAMSSGRLMLQRPHVRTEVQRLREIRFQETLATVNDLVDLHMRIAFADLGAYVEFGRKTVEVMGAFGPLKDKQTGEPVTKEINDVRFLESACADTQLLAAVKVGRDGASISLRDQEKSMAFLERFFSANPMDKHRREYDNKRLELEARAVAAKEKDVGMGDDDESTGVVVLPDVALIDDAVNPQKEDLQDGSEHERQGE